MNSYVVRTHYTSFFDDETFYQDIPLSAESPEEAVEKAIRVIMSDGDMRPEKPEDIEYKVFKVVYE